MSGSKSCLFFTKTTIIVVVWSGLSIPMCETIRMTHGIGVRTGMLVPRLICSRVLRLVR